MTTLAPNQAPGAEVYEDMFKEITRKLYGEEAPNNLHTPATQIGPDVDRSFLVNEIIGNTITLNLIAKMLISLAV